MTASSTIVAAALLLVIALAAGALYAFGVPKDVKHSLEEKVLQTMGENEASIFVNNTIHQLPEDNQLQTHELKVLASELTGKALHRPECDAVNVGGHDAYMSSDASRQTQMTASRGEL
ncbi:hypothetical protein AMS68_001355 [Peltaster fructicola]|uniref:Uncharacterized protein n=1 Tax=Peltaster fructicola TaxID=286661 RepID=A0A6H0XMI8_9PEZI|nr:hypothetical protein AMS68_001355 [Peltaster fructicola]